MGMLLSASVILLFALLPAYLLRVQIYGVPFNYLEIATYVLAVAVFIRGIAYKAFRDQIIVKFRWLKQNQKTFLISVCVFLALMALSLFYTIDARRTAGILKGWFFAPVLASLIFFMVFERKHWSKFIAAISSSAAILSGYGLWKYYATFESWYANYDLRLLSVFTSANYHALFIVPVMALSLAFLLYRNRGGVWWWTTLSATLINLTALYFTFSYGGYLALGAVLLFLMLGLIRGRGLNYKASGLIFAVFILLGLAAAGSMVKSEKFQRDFFDIGGV